MSFAAIGAALGIGAAGAAGVGGLGALGAGAGEGLLSAGALSSGAGGLAALPGLAGAGTQAGLLGALTPEFASGVGAMAAPEMIGSGLGAASGGFLPTGLTTGALGGGIANLGGAASSLMPSSKALMAGSMGLGMMNNMMNKPPQPMSAPAPTIQPHAGQFNPVQLQPLFRR